VKGKKRLRRKAEDDKTNKKEKKRLRKEGR
jgi:hypothetical protein